MTKKVALVNSNNIVVQVILSDNIEWCNNTFNETCVEISTDKNRADIGDIYYPELNNFSKPSPGNDYILNENLIWVLPQNKIDELNREIAYKKLRDQRDIKLSESDKYTSIPDWPHPSEEVKQAWITYRQELRDLPEKSTPQLDRNGELIGVIWPNAPSN